MCLKPVSIESRGTIKLDPALVPLKVITPETKAAMEAIDENIRRALTKSRQTFVD